MTQPVPLPTLDVTLSPFLAQHTIVPFECCQCNVRIHYTIFKHAIIFVLYTFNKFCKPCSPLDHLGRLNLADHLDDCLCQMRGGLVWFLPWQLATLPAVGVCTPQFVHLFLGRHLVRTNWTNLREADIFLFEKHGRFANLILL
jgi:hypothetical protein